MIVDIRVVIEQFHFNRLAMIGNLSVRKKWSVYFDLPTRLRVEYGDTDDIWDEYTSGEYAHGISAVVDIGV
jgi:hypothetical protein